MMRIVKKPRSAASIKSSRVVAEDAIEEMVEVEPAATELVLEMEDAAELVAEITDETVEVEIDEETEEITFTVGDTPYTIEPDGTEEILESSRKVLKGKSPVKASRRSFRRARR